MTTYRRAVYASALSIAWTWVICFQTQLCHAQASAALPGPAPAPASPPQPVSSGVNLSGGALQAGASGEPNISSSYLQAAASFDQAAAQTTGERQQCYRNWANYYRQLAAQLQSNSTVQPVAPTCDPFAQDNGASAGGAAGQPQQGAATAGPALPDGFTSQEWQMLRPQQRALLSSLNSLKGLLQNEQAQQIAPAQSWEDDRAQHQNEYLQLWQRVAARMKPIRSDPDYDAFLHWANTQPNGDFMQYDIDQIVTNLSRTGTDVVDDFTVHHEIQETQKTLPAVHREEIAYSQWKQWQLQQAFADALAKTAPIRVPPTAAQIAEFSGKWSGKWQCAFAMPNGQADIRTDPVAFDIKIEITGNAVVIPPGDTKTTIIICEFGRLDNGELTALFRIKFTDPGYPSSMTFRLRLKSVNGQLVGQEFMSQRSPTTDLPVDSSGGDVVLNRS